MPLKMGEEAARLEAKKHLKICKFSFAGDRAFAAFDFKIGK